MKPRNFENTKKSNKIFVFFRYVFLGYFVHVFMIAFLFAITHINNTLKE